MKKSCGVNSNNRQGLTRRQYNFAKGLANIVGKLEGVNKKYK